LSENTWLTIILGSSLSLISSTCTSSHMSESWSLADSTLSPEIVIEKDKGGTIWLVTVKMHQVYLVGISHKGSWILLSLVLILTYVRCLLQIVTQPVCLVLMVWDWNIVCLLWNFSKVSLISWLRQTWLGRFVRWFLLCWILCAKL
jgi:hypothetical protein